MLEVEFARLAQSELELAGAYYTPLSEGLERAFYREIALCVQLIRTDPEAFPALTMRIRKISTKRFPYILLYAVSGEKVVVLRLVHNRSDPESWT